jgi:hypothetical protein
LNCHCALFSYLFLMAIILSWFTGKLRDIATVTCKSIIPKTQDLLESL